MNINPHPRPNTLDWSMADIERDLLEAKRRISELFPEQGANSFAYPCYEFTVGRGRNRYWPRPARTDLSLHLLHAPMVLASRLALDNSLCHPIRLDREPRK